MVAPRLFGERASLGSRRTGSWEMETWRKGPGSRGKGLGEEVAGFPSPGGPSFLGFTPKETLVRMPSVMVTFLGDSVVMMAPSGSVDGSILRSLWPVSIKGK